MFVISSCSAVVVYRSRIFFLKTLFPLTSKVMLANFTARKYLTEVKKVPTSNCRYQRSKKFMNVAQIILLDIGATFRQIYNNSFCANRRNALDERQRHNLNVTLKQGCIIITVYACLK